MPTLLKLKPTAFIFSMALFFAALHNWPIFNHFHTILTQLGQFKLGFALSIPLLLIAALNVVFMPFALRWVSKPFFAVLMLLSAPLSYSMLHYGVIFDSDMLQNIFETDSSEAEAYISPASVAWVLATGVLPAISLLFIQIDYSTRWYKEWATRLAAVALSLLVIAAIAALYYQDYVSVVRNNRSLNREIIPTSFVYSASKYALAQRQDPLPFTTIANDARRTMSDQPTLMFFVLGETARAQNFASNGYAKDTNPFTQATGNVLSFQDVSSCGTATAVSVPCMFSPLTRKNFNNQQARNSEGLLDVLQKTDVNVLWKENDGGCKGVCARVPTVTIDPKQFPAHCNSHTCYDEVLLENLNLDSTYKCDNVL
ncbi:MAG: phosphoethanolamine transferase [Aeromonas sp.]